MSTSHLTAQHEHLREQVRTFAEAEVVPRVAQMESSMSVDHELPTLIAQQGWVGATVPTAYGGMAADEGPVGEDCPAADGGLAAGHLAKTIIIEELGRACGAMAAMVQASQLGTAKIIYSGNDEQKNTWLPQIAAGTCLPTIAVTEKVSGSHVLGMQSSARRKGRGYVLNGRKVFVGNSHIGHLHGVVMRTGEGSRGLSAFLVEADRRGVTVAPHQPSLGLHGFSLGEVIFDNCHIPAANLIGEEGDGLNVAYSSSVLYGRPNLAAVSLGIHQSILDETIQFVKQRKRYGGSLSELPTIQQKLGLMQSRLITARTMVYEAVHLLDRGAACDAELMNSKYISVEATIDSARAAMEIHAADGLRTDRPLQRLVRDAFHTWAPAGTGDVQLHRLAEEALGASQGQWSQRLARSAV
ncbi:acyl-CoA dehydrogenase family protein [Streptomyces botrytidirepellens]|uniref:Acyl-CoA dehydrogenase n=1 Tax=Streptomyces botrytidirepellens TaxID=2486417 RepID=A0A3M8X867_9ACTN|nr:acyl-CoA dehydrogenase family protein [Streptomyces botrytidirepellens]RNG37360.1 acyl-CoA dehydrogenase [Streptomyces botrytidirepellens]